jgi:hypothetical protein
MRSGASVAGEAFVSWPNEVTGSSVLRFDSVTISVFEQTSFWVDYFWLTALRRTRPCPPEAIQTIVDFVDRPGEDIAWQMGADGHWVCGGADAYSIRVTGNSQFPWASLEDLVERARAAVRDGA